MSQGVLSGGSACYDCGGRAALESWAPAWDDTRPPRYARCVDRAGCEIRAQKTRDRAARRQGLLVLAEPPSPSDHRGECAWCGAELRRRQDGEPSRRARCELRHEGRDCAKAWQRSRTYDVREAIRWRDLAVHGCVRCADCGVVCETADDVAPAVAWEGDHELPLEDGGEHVLENVRARCVGCHRRKTARENSTRMAQRRAGVDAERHLAAGQLEFSALAGGTP